MSSISYKDRNFSNSEVLLDRWKTLSEVRAVVYPLELEDDVLKVVEKNAVNWRFSD